MAYTRDEWKALSDREKQVAVEGIAKSLNIKKGRRVTLDYRMIGTDIKEAVVLRVQPNTVWDSGVSPDDERAFPDPDLNLTIVVEADDGRIIEVNRREITKVINR